ncbi:FadR/GntR family transcriptional regulator [Bordetella holmesii]|uniref:Pyruvate dehydrogenase complex repressor n=2 Tax=Bordetella holmesii TaxID=35814 RepID=A0A158M6H6_9BORD|nr:FCD domain-containing protein [Bordetella holmesii]AHV91888.1 bacterial regulatory s, gntR family protein [Bordetella holmesii ATCC 51541]AIT25809.1 bacterial regulatory s, gntR family protein [Bordetella holmesii 44057]EWM43817.1 bacterial regulatory s, gntR family protein [Bordetella holmesii 41130]EWM46375.1 bacterial regulatory s, gntR family protein [Bordetella holmesii 35009]EWM50538.1 bacterial regulatory s, gntR family protein [Bordetella holmesii 70147]
MQTKTLTEQVACQLADEIGRGDYPVGEKLPSGRALAQRYGVSAAVIREATERLRSQGLVRSRQGSGCTVIARTRVQGFELPLEIGLDRVALSAVYELRMDLEAGAAALAAQRRDAADLQAMQCALSALELHLEDPVQGSEHDVAFHLAIARATHNEHYQRLLHYLNLQLRQAVSAARANTARQQGLPRAVHGEHIAVFQAIAAGNAEAARQAALLHLRNASVRLQLDFSLTA